MCLSRSTSRTLRIDNLSAGIGNPALLQGLLIRRFDRRRERRSGRLHRLSAIIGTLSGLRRNPVRNASDSALQNSSLTSCTLASIVDHGLSSGSSETEILEPPTKSSSNPRNLPRRSPSRVSGNGNATAAKTSDVTYMVRGVVLSFSPHIGFKLNSLGRGPLHKRASIWSLDI